jgi:Protein of unknown function (DUF3105)
VPAEHRRARRAAGAIATAVVALAGGIALLLFFVARDDAPVDQGAKDQEVKGPGQAFPDQGAKHVAPSQRGQADYDSNPPTSGPHVPEPVRRDGIVLTDDQILHALELGNVVVVYGTAAPPAGLRALAADVSGGPFEPALVQAGQAVILARRPGTNGVVALAWRHLQRAPSAGDPQLRQFAEFWLGRGAQR